METNVSLNKVAPTFAQRLWKASKGLFTIALAVFSVYTYEVSIRKRDPTFIDVSKVKILSTDEVQTIPFTITKAGGEPINHNVYLARFYFFNQGEESIKSENVLKGITVGVRDSLAEILDCRILKTSRDVIDISFRKDTIHKNIAQLNFNILETNDGFVGLLIYENSNESNLTVSGTIEGSGNEFSKSYFYKYPYTNILLYLGGIFGALYAINFLFFTYTKNPNKISKVKGSTVANDQDTTLMSWFKTRFQLIIRNEQNFAEKTSVGFTYSKVILFSVFLFFLFFIFSLFMVKTILARWFDPKYKIEISIPETLQ